MGTLAEHYSAVQRHILAQQHPVTGLLPGGSPGPAPGPAHHAWVRDNVYSVSAVWALSMAYRRQQDGEEGRARTYQLEQATVKCMRGLLVAMMGQREKVERFKSSFCSKDALHAKYCCATGRPAVGDREWGHLQIDATALYLLTLAQMTASGLQIIFTLDEVAFIQNLVFYIECAYVIPDYGMWERGDKSNQSIVELNSSSVGMAQAALMAISGLNLFGGRGGPASVVHVLPDETVKCSAVLESMLPRESNSKETDASILSIIGYPAFAVRSGQLVEDTLGTLLDKLGGRYGMKRFLRDGYNTPRENPDRLHYEPWELRQFDNIECEWPLFYCYLAISYMFSGQRERAREVSAALDRLTVEVEDEAVLPELYRVQGEDVSVEYRAPGQAERVAAGRIPFMWAQSLYIISKLLLQELLVPAELDPLNRRLSSVVRPDVVVQVVVLAEDSEVQSVLAAEGIHVETPTQVLPVQVQPATLLSHLYRFLGRNRKLGLTGRRSLDVGILATSRFYTIQGQTFIFTPQSFDRSVNYMDTDPSLAMSTLAYSLNYLATNWRELGRPTVTLILSPAMLEADGAAPRSIVRTLRKLASGYINGTRVALGNHHTFLPTSCCVDLAFLAHHEAGQPDRLDPEVSVYLSKFLQRAPAPCPGEVAGRRAKAGPPTRSLSHSGAVRRTRSIKLSLEASHDLVTAMQDMMEADTVLGQLQGQAGQQVRARLGSDALYGEAEEEELLELLQHSTDLEEKGDILQFLVAEHGLQYRLRDGPALLQLVKQLYDSACLEKHWSIVRHASGLLGKKMPNLALSLTDLIVRQKQVTVGLPHQQEVIISRPLGAMELRDLILRAHQGDISTAALTQEILIYLAIFIRTEPTLFHGMIRIRVGLIIQVMASELGRGLGAGPEEAADRLLSLSPFETKTLLHHLLSGREYGLSSGAGSKTSIVSRSSVVCSTGLELAAGEEGRAGTWARRRLLDGSLNRVPAGFYTRLWAVLERCGGILVADQTLPTSLTQEMTSGEMKFHLTCESVLNLIPEPEFRQLVVEALLILVLAVEYSVVPHLGGTVRVEQIVRRANAIFLSDLTASVKSGEGGADRTGGLPDCSAGPAGIAKLFYDSAPSGTYGTMSYLVRAAATELETIPSCGEIDCNLM